LVIIAKFKILVYTHTYVSPNCYPNYTFYLVHILPLYIQECRNTAKEIIQKGWKSPLENAFEVANISARHTMVI